MLASMLGVRSLHARTAASVVAVSLATSACESFHEFDGAIVTRDAASPDAPPTLIIPHDAANDAHDAGIRDATTPSPFTIVQGTPAGETLLAIWGSDADDVFAVGTNGLHCDFYQSTWHCTQDVIGRDYYAVWGTRESDVYAVGQSASPDGGVAGIIEHFDGTGWTDQYLAPTPVYGVWGAMGYVLAVGSHGSLYAKMDSATTWNTQGNLPANPDIPPTADGPILWSVSGSGPNDFEIAADLDRVFHYIGAQDFVTLDPDVDDSIVFKTVWSVPGQTGSAFFGTNNFGISWLTTDGPHDAAEQADNIYRIFEDRSLPGADQLFIHGIWGTSAKAFFVGDLGRMYSFDEGTTNLTPVVSPTTSSLYGVWGSSPGDVWVVGDGELILHGTL